MEFFKGDFLAKASIVKFLHASSLILDGDTESSVKYAAV